MMYYPKYPLPVDKKLEQADPVLSSMLKQIQLTAVSLF